MIKRKRTLAGIVRRAFSFLFFVFLAAVLAIGWAQGRDFSWAFKDRIETRLSAEMGHPVSVEGAVGFHLGWSSMQVFVGDITTNLGEEESAFEASVFAERAGMTLGLRELLQGRVALYGLLLREARITLPVPEDAGGDAGAADRNPDFILRMLDRLRRVTLDNLTLIRLRPEGAPQVVDVDSLIIAPEEEGLHAAFVGDVQGTPYDVDAVIGDFESFLRFEGSPVTLTASIGRNNVEGRGTLTRVWPFEADLDLSGDAQDVARLAELMGGSLPGAGAARFSGHLAIEERRAELRLADLDLRHNGANGEEPATAVGPANGTLTIERVDGARFRVTGEIAAGLARIDPLFAAPQRASRTTVAEVIETPLETGLPFGARRVPYRDVRRFEGEVAVAVSELHFRDAVFEDVSLPLTDAGGIFRIDGARAIYGGQPLSLTLTANAEERSVAVEAHAHQVEIGELTEALGGRSFVHGPALVAVEGTGRGETVGEVLQSFTGQSNLMVGRGRLERGGIDFLAADLLRAFFSDSGQDTTPLVCLISRIDFAEGVGTSRAFLMDTNLITITGQGQVNLARNNIDFRLAPRPKDPTLLSLAADYKVEGPVMNPAVSPEPGGLLRGVATTLGSLALTGGAAALLPLLAGPGEDDLANPCISALMGEEEADPAAPEAAE